MAFSFLSRSASSRKSIISTRLHRHRKLHVETLELRALLAAVVGGVSDDGDRGDGRPPFEMIVNGNETTEYPSVGMIGEAFGGYCTGTLIAPRFVLSAAHCAEGVGQTAGRFFTDDGAVYATSRIYIHPGYQPFLLGTDEADDIAIYQLNREVVGITPSPFLKRPPVVGEMLTMVGYGAGGTAANGHDGTFGTKRVGFTPIDKVSQRLIEWDYDDPAESNTAPGDSGGPAFVMEGDVLTVAGVVSGGFQPNAGLGDHSFDTRVDYYQDWIEGIIGSVVVSVVASDAVAAETLAAEPVNTGEFTISIPKAQTRNVIVSYQLSGTARNGTDFQSLSGTAIILAGTRQTKILVRPIDDNLVEGTETVRLTIVEGSGYSIDLGSAVVSILDNESPNLPVVSVSVPDNTARETLLGQTVDRGVFRIERSGPQQLPMEVAYSIGGTATNGVDYQALSGVVVIPAGQGSTTIHVLPIDDAVYEGAETVILALRPRTNYVVHSELKDGRVTILDNDPQNASANDHFEKRVLVSGTTVNVVGNNSLATRQAGEPNILNVSGGKSVWWTWQAPETGAYNVFTTGSSFDTTLGVYRGFDYKALTTVAVNDDENFQAGVFTSRVRINATAGFWYQILVDGYAGASGHIRLRINKSTDGRIFAPPGSSGNKVAPSDLVTGGSNAISPTSGIGPSRLTTPVFNDRTTPSNLNPFSSLVTSQNPALLAPVSISSRNLQAVDSVFGTLSNEVLRNPLS